MKSTVTGGFTINEYLFLDNKSVNERMHKN